jgi:predicted TIM-barrel fold metal-dependent hydrolase
MLIDAHAHLHAGPESLARLLASMDALSIDRTVVVLGGVVPPQRLTEVSGDARERGLSLPCDNRRILEQCRHAQGRLLPFYFANPWVDPEEYRRIGASFYGLKLGPAVHGAPLLGPETRAYVELAATFDHPVYLHCLDRDGFRVSDLVRLALDFPKVRFILGHGGVGQLDFDCVDQIAPLANIAYETSGAFSAPVKHACARLGTDRVIFGSEYPLQSARAEVAKLHDLDLDRRALRAVGGQNILRLLGKARYDVA